MTAQQWKDYTALLEAERDKLREVCEAMEATEVFCKQIPNTECMGYLQVVNRRADVVKMERRVEKLRHEAWLRTMNQELNEAIEAQKEGTK